MEKEFCLYEEALALKELGFAEPCVGGYPDDEIKTKVCLMNILSDGLLKNPEDEDCICLAPLYQQVFRWFREEHSLFHNIWNYTHCEPTNKLPDGFAFSIDEDWTCIVGKKDGLFEKYYNTYEEAELACLKKLIEIVKEKK